MKYKKKFATSSHVTFLIVTFTFSLTLFQLICVSKNLHDHFTTTYGLPVWASFAIFGVATILAGIILGIVSITCTYELPYFLRKP